MKINVRNLGLVAYESSFRAMRKLVDDRKTDTPDELWFLQHPPVFTQGQGGSAAHVLNPGDIPIVQSDRGGQVTYHGPGQLVAYVLMDLKRTAIGPKTLVRRIESGLIDYLQGCGITAARRDGAPGVYSADAKIAALGLRIRRGMSYHGLSLNVNPDLEPFSRINPCGYEGLAVTSMEELGFDGDCDVVSTQLTLPLLRALYNSADVQPNLITDSPFDVALANSQSLRRAAS